MYVESEKLVALLGRLKSLNAEITSNGLSGMLSAEVAAAHVSSIDRSIAILTASASASGLIPDTHLQNLENDLARVGIRIRDYLAIPTGPRNATGEVPDNSKNNPARANLDDPVQVFSIVAFGVCIFIGPPWALCVGIATFFLRLLSIETAFWVVIAPIGITAIAAGLLFSIESKPKERQFEKKVSATLDNCKNCGQLNSVDAPWCHMCCIQFPTKVSIQ